MAPAGDIGQCIGKQRLNAGVIFFLEFFFGNDPQIVILMGNEMPVQTEEFAHFSFDKITFHRIPDLAVNGDRESMERVIVP